MKIMESENVTESVTELAAAPCSAPHPRTRHGEEIRKRRVDVENEWQSAEDWLDDGNLAEAEYYMDRMIKEARQLRRSIKAATQEPNAKVRDGGGEA